MLNDKNTIAQRDPSDALGAILNLPEQTKFQPLLKGYTDGANIENIVMAGMGGSALAADMIKVLTRDSLSIPFEVVKGYSLPAYTNQNTLVIAISHSGNTEETLSCYDQAKEQGSKLVAMATGGALLQKAEADGVLHSIVPQGAQPRMSTVYHLRTLLYFLQHMSLIDDSLSIDLEKSTDWLNSALQEWAPGVPVEHNYAKQLAEKAAGKTGMFEGGELTGPIAYKWKISWNESAKNVAFYNQYPEINHNEFIGWSSHPIEKPFAVFDIKSDLELPRIAERMEVSERMLSGMRPHATSIQLQGETLLRQFLWGLALGDMTSTYLGILNNVDPVPVVLIENFKKSLS